MDIAFLVIAFVAAFLAVFRSLGSGFVAVAAVGYFSGVIRAKYLGVYTTLMFDAAVVGLYLGFLCRKPLWDRGARSAAARWFVFVLTAWPTLLCLVPVNHYLIQFVGLRAAILFLPVLLIATRLTTADLAFMTRGLVVLNLMALAVGVYIYLNGLEAVYPKNAITQLMYRSNDVAGYKYHRVPSSFLSGHAYGGTMLYTLPFLIDRLAAAKVHFLDRCLAVAGIVAAAGGILMCGARSPIVVFAVAVVVAWMLTGLSLKLGLVVAILLWAGFSVARNDERLQRASTVQDSEFVSQRIAGSVNVGFLELMMKYPFGAGLGSAVGTSLPYFLSHLAPEQIGLENEYGRILVEQGWPGLIGWLAFSGWLYALPPRSRSRPPWWLGVVLMYSVTLSFWATAFIGTGILASVPATFFMLTQMGVLVSVRALGTVPEPVSIRPGISWEFSSPLPLDSEGQSWQGAGTPSGPVAGIGFGYRPPQSSRAKDS
jgi:hypothetical protein